MIQLVCTYNVQLCALIMCSAACKLVFYILGLYSFNLRQVYIRFIIFSKLCQAVLLYWSLSF